MNPVERAFLKTPIGYIEVEGSEAGIRSLHFLSFPVRIKRIPHLLHNCIQELSEYFEGSRQKFDLPLALEGTPFQIKVWNELIKIPYGHVITYHELAMRTGNPDALRAVGGANAKNPVSVIVPCHRVIGSDGKLVGYEGGLWRKKWLLEHEHALDQMDLFPNFKKRK